MDQERHKRNYALHSWSGLVLGLFVFVVCFSGSLALFYEELEPWEDASRRLAVPEKALAMDATFDEWVGTLAGEEGELGFARFGFPNHHAPFYWAFVEIETPTEDGGHDHEFREARWHPETGEEIPLRGEGAANWILRFHQYLMWPSELGGVTVGRGLVGIAGVILLMSIISGVVAHTKIFQELFTLRFYRSMRLKWQDTHKVVGLWGLPFFTMIAVTGAFLGVVTLLAPVVALLTFKGDQEALIEAVIGAPVEPAGIEAEMLPLQAVAEMTSLEHGGPAQFVIINNYGDQNATMDVYFEAGKKLEMYDPVQISGVTGEPVADSPFEDLSPANRTLAAVTPLHYGTYGGIALKVIYMLLGFGLAGITALGMMMWVERRLHGSEGTKSTGLYRAISKTTVGVTCGMPLASVGILYADQLLPALPDTRTAVIGWSYFAFWGIGVAYAFVRSNDYAASKELLWTTAALLVGAPVLNAVTTGDVFLTELFSESGAAAAWINMGLLVLGLILAVTVKSWPRARTEKATRRTVSAGELAAAPAE
ncbi:MAG: PepSY-associated TM helix domain-containing protein [Pseudomonadota bacterium]